MPRIWPQPKTWVSGEVVTADMFNRHLRDNLNYLHDKIEATEKAKAAEIHIPGEAVVAGVAVLAAAAEVKRPLSRRSLLFPWRRA